MKKFVKTVCSLLTLISLAVLILTPATAYGSPPTEFSGTFTSGPVIPLGPPQQADGNLIVKQIEYGNLAGDVVGPFTFERTVIVHSNGKVNMHGVMTVEPVSIFDIDISGSTYTQIMNARIVAGTIQGQWTILSGTGDLANVHGQGTFTGSPRVGGTYSGKIHFDPN